MISCPPRDLKLVVFVSMHPNLVQQHTVFCLDFFLFPDACYHDFIDVPGRSRWGVLPSTPDVVCFHDSEFLSLVREVFTGFLSLFHLHYITLSPGEILVGGRLIFPSLTRVPPLSS